MPVSDPGILLRQNSFMTKSREQRRGNLRQSVSLRLGDQEDSDANSRAGEHHRSRSSGEEVILFETPSA